MAEAGWKKDVIESQLARAVESGDIVRIGEVFMHAPAWEALKAQIVPTVEEFHRQNPLASGIGKEELRVRTDAKDEAFDAIAATLARENRIEIAGDLVRLPGRGVVMKDEEAESRRVIEQTFAAAGLKVPALKDVLAGLKIDQTRAHKIMTLLLREKVLIKVSDDLVFHQSALAGLRKSLAAQKLISPRLDVARFKEITGVSRKYAIPLLEYLDRERVTKRVGNDRVIL